jgi:hypothetical protein
MKLRCSFEMEVEMKMSAITFAIALIQWFSSHM